MFGDVFGNRATLLSEYAPSEPQTPMSAGVAQAAHVVPRWQPLVATLAASHGVQYGYDPWTKSYFRLDQGIKWWCFKPADATWHAAVQYTLGSVIFVLASVFALFRPVREDVQLNRWLFAYPYMLGSVTYTIGATILVIVSWQNHPDKVRPVPRSEQVSGREQSASPRFLAGREAAAGRRDLLLVDGAPAPCTVTHGAIGNGNGADRSSRRSSSNGSRSGGGVGRREGGAGGSASEDDREYVSDDNLSHPIYSSYGVSVRDIMPDDSDEAEPPSLPTKIVLQPAGPPNVGDRRGGGRPSNEEDRWASPPNSGAAGRERSRAAVPLVQHGAAQRARVTERSRSPFTRWPVDLPALQRERFRETYLAADRDGAMSPAPSDYAASVARGAERSRSVDVESVATAATGDVPYHVANFMGRWRTTSTAENISTALLAYQDRRPEAIDQMVRQFYMRDAYYHIRADPWYRTRWRLDLAGTLSIFVGALLYNVSCFTLAFKAAYLRFPRTGWADETCSAVLEVWPDVVGGALFCLGSWAFWWAAHGTPWPIVSKPFTLTWYLTAFNMLGSVGFYYGAASHVPVGSSHILVPNWFELLVGYVVGSAFFLLGSYLMIAEIATSHA